MSVVQLRPEQETHPLNVVPAIRTPDQYRAAHERVTTLLDGLSASTLTTAVDRVEEALIIRRAMNESPFMLADDDRIVPRGCRPQAVR